MEPLYRGHIGTLETILYIEAILNFRVFFFFFFISESTIKIIATLYYYSYTCS